MKFFFPTSTTAAAIVSLAIPVCLSAQDALQHPNPKHHHYKVVEMGTFGGPTSSIDATGHPPFSMFNKILTRSGAMLAGADTPIADPDEFAGPWVNYAFRWEDGVQSNLGVLPERPRVDPRRPAITALGQRLHSGSPITAWSRGSLAQRGRSADELSRVVGRPVDGS